MVSTSLGEEHRRIPTLVHWMTAKGSNEPPCPSEATALLTLKANI